MEEMKVMMESLVAKKEEPKAESGLRIRDEKGNWKKA
jgi:hypothetical protein